MDEGGAGWKEYHMAKGYTPKSMHSWRSYILIHASRKTEFIHVFITPIPANVSVNQKSSLSIFEHLWCGASSSNLPDLLSTTICWDKMGNWWVLLTSCRHAVRPNLAALGCSTKSLIHRAYCQQVKQSRFSNFNKPFASSFIQLVEDMKSKGMPNS
jgi:hypothetical protein